MNTITYLIINFCVFLSVDLLCMDQSKSLLLSTEYQASCKSINILARFNAIIYEDYDEETIKKRSDLPSQENYILVKGEPYEFNERKLSN